MSEVRINADKALTYARDLTLLLRDIEAGREPSMSASWTLQGLVADLQAGRAIPGVGK